MKSKHTKGWMRLIVSGVMLAAAVMSTGCQVSMSGQTLPSPFYYMDDVQYFPAGPEMKLQNEANQQKAFRAQQELEQR